MKAKSYWLTQDQIDDLLDVLVNQYYAPVEEVM